MAADKIPCPICGKLFTPCKAAGPYNWRKYFCSSNCSEINEARIMESRAKAQVDWTEDQKKKDQEEFLKFLAERSNNEQ